MGVEGHQLPDQAQRGEERALASLANIERLYRSRFHQYLRVAEAITGDPDRGLDAVQEGFAQAIRFREDFRGNSQLATWVWRCVVNSAKGTRPPQETALAEDIEDRHAAQPATSPSIKHLIAELPERQRVALFLRYYADMDYRSIANVLGIKIGTVGATLNDAHANLRSGLEDDKEQ